MSDIKKSLVFPNVHEYMYRGMNEKFPLNLLEEWRQIAAGYAEISILWQGEEKLIMSPKPIDDEIIRYHKDKLGFKSIQVTVPNIFTSNTTQDFIQDKNCMKAIKEYITAEDKVNLISWGATEEIYNLIDSIQSNKLISSEIPDYNNYWTSSYLDTKVGFKEVCRELGLNIPKGYTCGNLKEALWIIRGFCQRSEPCILKANTGAGGFGNVFISEKLIQRPFSIIEEYIYKTIEEMPYFNKGAMLVEEWIEKPKHLIEKDSANIASGFASAQILQDGSIILIGGGIDQHDANNYYVGARMGIEIFPSDLWGKLSRIMYQIGEEISNAGYRGHWGINYMLRKNGEITLIELNSRRCGESHVHSIAQGMEGTDWMKRLHVISYLPMGVEVKDAYSISHLLENFDEWDRKDRDISVIPVQLSWLKKERFKGIGYMILGHQKESVTKMDVLVKNELSQMGIHPNI